MGNGGGLRRMADAGGLLNGADAEGHVTRLPMQADDLIQRRQLSPTSAGVRYTVTSYGRTLGPVFEALWRWGAAHLERVEAVRGTMVAPPHSRA